MRIKILKFISNYHVEKKLFPNSFVGAKNYPNFLSVFYSESEEPEEEGRVIIIIYSSDNMTYMIDGSC